MGLPPQIFTMYKAVLFMISSSHPKLHTAPFNLEESSCGPVQQSPCGFSLQGALPLGFIDAALLQPGDRCHFTSDLTLTSV